MRAEAKLFCQSTLSQIRTKGINRGGLYGFFVKGEAIAGTIDDTSADATDASAPSRTSTPPTSDSDSDAPTKPIKMSEQPSKRKREEDDTSVANKKVKDDASSGTPEKAKEERRAKGTPRDPTKTKHGKTAATPEEQEAVDKKIAKMSERKKAWYEEKAGAKNQTVEQYLLRRVQKSFKKLNKRNKLKAAKEARTKPATSTPMFVTDLEGDATLIQTATSTTPGQPVLTPDAASLAILEKAEAKRLKRKEKKEAKKLLPPKKGAKPRVEYKGRNDYRKAMKEKKERKKAEKAEKHKGGRKTKSKWGDNKEHSRWGRLKAEKKAAKAAKEGVAATGANANAVAA